MILPILFFSAGNLYGSSLYAPHSPASSVTPILDMENGMSVMHNWHLVKKQNHDSLRKGDKYHTLMAEIYLPRLLTTKVGLDYRQSSQIPLLVINTTC